MSEKERIDKIDTIIAELPKSCDNCQDWIVCYAYGKEFTLCDDWHLDFLTFQGICIQLNP